MLVRRRMTIALAESCTGGLITHKLASVPGISKVLIEGVVAYRNDSKLRRIGVSQESLDRYGAVSRAVANEMAVGIARTAGARVGVSSTGIAGPTGGSKDKPVGLVFTAVSVDGRTRVNERIFPGNRNEVRERAADHALNLLRLALLEL